MADSIQFLVDRQTDDSGSHFYSKKEGKDQESIQSSTTPDQVTYGKVTMSQLDITNESQEVSPFPAGDHKASTNRRASIIFSNPAGASHFTHKTLIS